MTNFTCAGDEILNISAFGIIAGNGGSASVMATKSENVVLEIYALFMAVIFVVVSFFIRDFVDLELVVCIISLPKVVDKYTTFSHIIV